MARKRWPPLLIHAISAQSRSQLFAMRANLAQRIQNPLPIRHDPWPLGTEKRQNPKTVNRRGCIIPLSADSQRLQITHRWANHCFYPTYIQSRQQNQNDIYAVVDEIVRNEAPQCANPAAPATAEALEFVRRIQLATSILMRQEGIDVPMPYRPSYPPPSHPLPVSEPWLRALLTGWP